MREGERLQILSNEHQDSSTAYQADFPCTHLAQHAQLILTHSMGRRSLLAQAARLPRDLAEQRDALHGRALDHSVAQVENMPAGTALLQALGHLAPQHILPQAYALFNSGLLQKAKGYEHQPALQEM